MPNVVECVLRTENGAFYCVTNLFDVCRLHTDTMTMTTTLAHKFPERNIEEIHFTQEASSMGKSPSGTQIL